MSTIRPLPADVAGQIKSSTAIPSLSAAVIGLLKNALDARASRVEISVDFERCSCSIQDDGEGILPVDFEEEGGLAKPYHSSTFSLNAGAYYGGCGTFLSSLAALSVLTIISHHRGSCTASAIILHHSRPAARLIPASEHYQLSGKGYGTRVVVQDLFGKLPVRVRQRPIGNEATRIREREWLSLCRRIVGLLLASSNRINLTMKGTGKDQSLFIRPPSKVKPVSRNNIEETERSRPLDIPLIHSIMHSLGTEPSSWQTWVGASARTPFLNIRAYISLQPAPSKDMQFICLGVHPITHESEYNSFYGAVNRRFAASDFGLRDAPTRIDVSEKHTRRTTQPGQIGGFTNKQLKIRSKGTDRWPKFFIWVELAVSASTQTRNTDDSRLASHTVSAIIDVMDTMIIGFLKEHKFGPGQRRAQEAVKQTENISDKSLKSLSLPCRLNRKARSKEMPPEDLHNKQRPLNLSDDLGGTVEFPMCSKSQNIHQNLDPFSGWSRIKSGSSKEFKFIQQRHKKSNTISANLKDGRSEICGEKHIRIENVRPPSIQHKEKVPQLIAPTSSKATCVHRTDEGDYSTMIWADPVSKEDILINARTGFPVKRSWGCAPSISNTNCITANQQSVTNDVKLKRCKPIMLPPSVTGPWATSLLESWDNPVFQNPESGISLVSLQESSHEGVHPLHDQDGFSTGEGFKAASSSIRTRLGKSQIRYAEVIAQVDMKFVLVRVTGSSGAIASGNSQDDFKQLVLIDQHAADERIRVENLLDELCAGPQGAALELKSDLGYSSAIESVRLTEPIVLALQRGEDRLLRDHAAYFAGWGILFNLIPGSEGAADGNHAAKSKIKVLTLPPAIAERCRTDPDQLGEILRGEAWKREEEGAGHLQRAQVTKEDPSEGVSNEPNWLRRIHDCPQGILDMINSRSCRSSIMFNDKLDLEACKTLVRKLAGTAFPFQCAHGRPSMIPLVDLTTVGRGGIGCDMENGVFGLGTDHKEVDFEKAWVSWLDATGQQSATCS